MSGTCRGGRGWISRERRRGSEPSTVSVAGQASLPHVIALPPRTIAVVLDTGFGSRLASLAERAAVWIVDSPGNRPAIELLWTARRTRGASYDVTVFRTIPGLTAEEHVDAVLRSAVTDGETDEPAAPVGSIEVYGTELTDEMRSTLAKYDYPLIDPLGNDFRARRGTKA